MESCSEDEDDSEDNVPLSRAFGVAHQKPVVTPKSAAAATTANTAASKTTSATSKRPLAVGPSTSRVLSKRPKVTPAPNPPSKPKPLPKPQPSKPAARSLVANVVSPKPQAAASPSPSKQQVAKPSAKHVSSTGSEESSSESEEDDMSGDDDDDDETSSEEDDASEDDDDTAASAPVRRSRAERGSTTHTLPPAPAATAVATTAVGVLISSTARTAVERLNLALQALDSSNAPLSAQESIQKSKSVFSGNISDVIQNLCDGKRLTNAHVSSLLHATSSVALQLACVASGSDDVDREIQSFRRSAHQMHGVWDSTLPQLEALADAARKQQEAAAHASRVAAELLGSHTALANGVANALENMKRGK